jgi:release factor glutamine methyltransferase
MVIRDIINDAEHKLNENNIENGRMEVYILLEFILNKPKSIILCHDTEMMDKCDADRFNKLVKRRIEGEPLQYIINRQYFMGYGFYVDENVLIPRADTEIVVEKILEYSKNILKPKILDLCTGSGCIGISLNKKLREANIYASDISEKAIEVAKYNSKINEATVNFIVSDLFEAISVKDFDIIVSNPPYIEKLEIENLSKEVKREPLIALDGGKDGLLFYRRIIKDSKKYLKNNGMIFLEIGYNQANEVGKILRDEEYKDIKIIKDYSQNDS